jgi:enterochelin esterase-like enzyme
MEPLRRLGVALLTLSILLPAQALSAESHEKRPPIVSISLFAPQLNRAKQIGIYLPPNYSTDAPKRFPVLYMQDGQYLFDPLAMSSDNPYIDEALQRKLQQGLGWFGNWQVDKQLDRLFAEKKTEGVIVVGISSGAGNRTSEYSPWPWYGAPQPEGDEYMAFIVRTLKPYIDANYRTLGGRADTGIAGSSMGGLIALYGGLKYQVIFSKVAAFSPVLTDHVVGRQLTAYITRRGKSQDMRIYADLGSEELGFGPVDPVYEALRGTGFLDEELWFRHIPDGEHRIAHWSKRFAEVLEWMFYPRAPAQ